MHFQFFLYPNQLIFTSDPGLHYVLKIWLSVMFLTAFLCFIISELSRNYSQVDKLWSLLPVIYGWIAAAYMPSARTIIMAILVTIWGARLTYNFHRKGGYSIIPWRGEEDYRWKVIRETDLLKGRFRFGIFNLLFISIYQNIVILLFTSPILLAVVNNENELNALDLIAAALMLLFIISEGIADNQLYRFHVEKKNRGVGNIRYSQSLEKGFLSEGLWKFARHPNFVSEQAVWVSFYLFGVAASGSLINITLIGPVLLILIFAGSTWLTEKITSSKYPDYIKYKSETPRFIPLLFRKNTSQKQTQN